MAQNLSLLLARTIERELPKLRELTGGRASIPRASGKWSSLRAAALEPQFHGPGYAQDDWVRLHGYQEVSWALLVEVWFQYNLLLAGLVKNIPEDRLDTACFIGANPAVTLRLLIEDYVFHMQHHRDQLPGRT
ncbi:MAG TPA: hypothetical protein VKT49_01560 [Bryobacteraceae bacterium]|nr:hypothetical protein [Bryobacteraceae bacterium]